MSLTVVVSGMIADTPGQGGATWAVLNHLLGLRQLGHEPYLVEPVATVDERRVSWCAAVMERHGLGGRWCLVAPDGVTAGMDRGALAGLGRRADVLLNVSGMLTAPEVMDVVPVRAYLDLDPAFVQLWHSVDGVDMRFDGHSHFVTVSDAVGRTIPDCGRAWIATLPPVALAAWPMAPDEDGGPLSTVAHWRSYGSIHHGGRHYGQKAHAFRQLIDLPQRIDLPVAVALGIHPDESDDQAALIAGGWRLLDPQTVAGTPEAYHHFVQGSYAELGVAKTGYVVSDSGWFSDRSACYLASGRPVIAQGTGFERRLPVGDGLLAFAGVDDAVDAIGTVRAAYRQHRQAARAIAEEHLDAGRVLAALLERLLP